MTVTGLFDMREIVSLLIVFLSFKAITAGFGGIVPAIAALLMAVSLIYFLMAMWERIKTKKGRNYRIRPGRPTPIDEREWQLIGKRGMQPPGASPPPSALAAGRRMRPPNMQIPPTQPPPSFNAAKDAISNMTPTSADPVRDFNAGKTAAKAATPSADNVFADGGFDFDAGKTDAPKIPKARVQESKTVPAAALDSDSDSIPDFADAVLTASSSPPPPERNTPTLAVNTGGDSEIGDIGIPPSSEDSKSVSPLAVSNADLDAQFQNIFAPDSDNK